MKRIWFVQDHPVNHTEGLEDLCKLFPSQCTMVEIGCMAGISTITFAKHCSKVYAVDPWDLIIPHGETINKRAIEAESRFDVNTSGYANITKMKMTSIDASKLFDNESVDGIYIDARHDYDSVKADLAAWKRKVKRGGIYSGHDYHAPGVHKAVREAIGLPYHLFSDMSWCKIKE